MKHARSSAKFIIVNAFSCTPSTRRTRRQSNPGPARCPKRIIVLSMRTHTAKFKSLNSDERKSGAMERDLLCLDTLFDQSPMLMDGGLGTTLEGEFGSTVSQSPIWSAHPIVHTPEAVVQTHLKFLETGARIISTATYQCSSDTLGRVGLDEEASKMFMLKCVHLANEARARFQAQAQSSNNIGGPMQWPSTFIALSLGPLGATLRPTQEFLGCYPPPYGPREFVAGGPNENAFERLEDEVRATDALARFHLDRLAVFAADHHTWNYIDCIAFETVPLRREVKAIRKAMTWLQQKFAEEGCNQVLKPWWISCVFPKGESPEDATPHGGRKVRIEQLLDAAYQDQSTETPLMTPSGFGVNCTELKYVPELIDKVRDYFNELEKHGATPPWIVLYPNGYDTYDEAEQVWITAEDDGGAAWANELMRVIERASIRQRLLVGGCCRTGTKEISSLHHLLKMVEHKSPTFSLTKSLQ